MGASYSATNSCGRASLSAMFRVAALTALTAAGLLTAVTFSQQLPLK